MPSVRELGNGHLVRIAREKSAEVFLRCTSQIGRAPMVGVFSAMIAGIVADALGFPSAHAWCLAGLLTPVWIIGQWRDSMRWTVPLLWGIITLSSAIWHHRWTDTFPKNELGLIATERALPVVIDARLLDVPRVFQPGSDPLSARPSGPYSQCRIAATSIRDGDSWRSASGNGSLLVSGELSGVTAGDEVRIVGHLLGPPEPRNPGEWNPREMATQRREWFRIRASSPDAVQVMWRGIGWDPRYWLARFRSASEQRLRQYLPDDVADLSAALIFGAQQCIDRDARDSFLATGTTHLLAVSGLHVMLLVGPLWSLLSLASISYRTRITSVVFTIAAYAALAGARAPVVRAAILVAVWGAEWFWHRRRAPWNALCAAGILILIANPTQLFHVGAQLSFLAMCVITVVVTSQRHRSPEEIDPLDRLLRRSRPRWRRALTAIGGRIASMFLVCTLITLVALPLVAARFHVVSLVGVVMNLILWVPVWVGMLSGFAAFVLVWLVPPLALPLLWIHAKSLAFILSANEFAEQLPGSHWWVAGPSALGLASFYGILLTSSCWVTTRKGWCISLAAAWLSLVPLWLWTGGDRKAHPDSVWAWFLAVGHGTCVVLEMPDQKIFVYDAGCLGIERNVSDTISRFLWHRGIRRIDGFVVSHADVDHFSAVPRLTRRFPVGRFFTNRMAWERRGASMELVRTAVYRAGIPVQWLEAGDCIWGRAGEGIEVLHPQPGKFYSSDNASSVVLMVTWGHDSLLLTGDIERDGIDDLCAQPNCPVKVAMAPHHGSVHTFSQGFLAWCQPEYVVISGRLPKGSRTLGKSLYNPAEVLHTDYHGAICIQLDQEPGLRYETWRRGAAE